MHFRLPLISKKFINSPYFRQIYTFSNNSAKIYVFLLNLRFFASPIHSFVYLFNYLFIHLFFQDSYLRERQG